MGPSGNQLQVTGDPVASFLLGQVDNANFNVNYRHMLNEQYISPWVNDEFKATKDLTLTLGLRFDYQGCLSDSRRNQSTFDPNTPNPGQAVTLARSSSRAMDRGEPD